MPHYVGLDVSQKTTAICVVDVQSRRLWRGVCATDPEPISARISKYAGADAKVGIETGSMTPWLVHGLRSTGLNVQCLDARRVKAALQLFWFGTARTKTGSTLDAVRIHQLEMPW